MYRFSFPYTKRFFYFLFFLKKKDMNEELNERMKKEENNPFGKQWKISHDLQNNSSQFSKERL